MKLPLFPVVAHLLGLLGLLPVLNFAVAQDFRIAEITLDRVGQPIVSFESKTSAYYVLFRGNTISSISIPVGTKLGTGGTMHMDDREMRPRGSFYRVQEVPREQSVKKDDNPTVPDVVGQFLATKRHPDYGGFYAGQFSGDTKCFLSDCENCISHYQGIVRGPGPGVPYLYISKNNNPEILVVRMGSRDTDGERLRSNRLSPNLTTGNTVPLRLDGEIGTVRFDDLDAIGLAHPGGMQVVGQTLAVGIDCHGWLLDPCDESLPIQGVLALLDLSNPEFPKRFYTQNFRHTLGGTALVKLPDDGRYLLLTAGEFGASLTAYISNFTDLHKPGLFFGYAGEWFDPRFGKYQGNYNIVKQSDGDLYLIGMHNPGGCYNPFQGADLWKLNTNFRGAGGIPFSLTFRESIELSCGNIGLGVACDFQAASGTYVSPSGELILYGTVHQRGDPFTEFAEFRRRDIVHPTAQPWVELYSEPFGWASAFGRSVVLDVADRHKDDFLDFTGLDPLFDNSARSVRWWAPPGCCIELLSNPCFMGNPGTVLSLEGTGEVRHIDNLVTTAIGDNTVSGVRFCFDAVTPYTCTIPQNCPPAACQVNGPDLIVLGIAADRCVNRGQSIAGTVTIKNIGNRPAFGFMDIGFSLSIDDNPTGGNDDIPMGILDLNLNPPLLPGQTRSFVFNTFPVPNSATETVQNLIAIVDLGLPPCAMICESCEGNNSSSTDVVIGRADVAITDLTYPVSVTSGDLVPITISIRNFGCNRVCNTLTACIGLFPNDCVSQPFCIEPFGTEEVTINVVAPASELDCGFVDNFGVSACLNFLDADNNNNCRSENIGITERYWDLDLSISSGDNSAGLGDEISYTVLVTNRGNSDSPSCVSFITGINCSAGPGQWGCMLVGDSFTRIGTVQRGETKPFPFTFRIPNCCAPPIIIGQQWLKAEILYTQGEACDDDCGEGFGNNFHQESIQITN